MAAFLITNTDDAKTFFKVLSNGSVTHMCGQPGTLHELVTTFFEELISAEMTEAACTAMNFTPDTLIKEHEFVDFLHYLAGLINPIPVKAETVLAEDGFASGPAHSEALAFTSVEADSPPPPPAVDATSVTTVVLPSPVLMAKS